MLHIRPAATQKPGRHVHHVSYTHKNHHMAMHAVRRVWVRRICFKDNNVCESKQNNYAYMTVVAGRNSTCSEPQGSVSSSESSEQIAPCWQSTTLQTSRCARRRSRSTRRSTLDNAFDASAAELNRADSHGGQTITSGGKHETRDIRVLGDSAVACKQLYVTACETDCKQQQCRQ